MRELIHAEWKKITRNIRLTAFLVWSYPVGLATLNVIFLLVMLVSRGAAAQGVLIFGMGDWRQDLLGAWGMVSSFPTNILGRMLPLAFMAVVFASEYQSGTWKNLIPRNRRWALVVAKLVTLIAVVMSSLMVTSLVAGLGQYAGHRLAGLSYEPAVSGPVLADFALDYTREAAMALAGLLLLALMAALAAMITRSVLGSLLVGFGFSVAEPMSMLFLTLVGSAINRPELIRWYRLTPSYHLDNIYSWLTTGEGFLQAGVGLLGASPGLAFSLAALALWLAGLLVLVLFLFQRQDITS